MMNEKLRANVRTRQMANSHMDLKTLILTVLWVTASNAGPPLSICDRREVFLDGRFIEEPRGVELVVHRPHKTGQIVLKCEQPW